MDDQRSTLRIAQAVRQLAPDIVCFQEIHQRMPQSGGENQPALLSHYLGRPFLFQRNLRIGPGNYGVGIAYRGHLVGVKEHALPSIGEQRGALELQLREVPGIGRLTLFCTHWGLDSTERLRQAEFLVSAINAARPPVILCGDLNEGPEAEGVRALIAGTGLTDSDSLSNRPTFTAANPSERIDYILYSSQLLAQYVEVVATQASDHCPVLADFVRA